MKLLPNWKSVLAGSWSVWLIALACVLSSVPVFVSLVSPGLLGVDPVMFAAAAAVVNALAIPARLVAQAGLSNALGVFRRDASGAMRKRAALGLGAGALVISLATPFIAKWEGVRLEAYRDIVGVPTICFGDTHGVRMGEKASMSDCVARLKADVHMFYAEISRCMTNPDIPAGVQASMLELAFNVGSGPVCRSTMMRLANAGQYSRACSELHRWVRAGGKRVRGLENRRADSKRALCMDGLS
ncbi:lysozyme [Pseudophaeobacter flagellatus]|uniref:lysozyme n=1 Tax=Pseudophaeobacter flagellatus TaxID=2899119 RepID=UPI001E47EDED|nr:lysozyme [Pseudophaeobacter flagellatus]MCD9147807.1 lysozyme [Pseudophaeobacter flagellatus]